MNSTTSTLSDLFSIPPVFILPLASFITFFLFVVVWMQTEHKKWDSPFRDLLERVPGQTLASRIDEFYEKLTLDLFGVFVFLFVWLLLVLKGIDIANFLSPIVSMLMTAWMIRTFFLISRLKQYQLRLKGEQLTAQYLQALLKDGFSVFYDIVLDTDRGMHVVVGSTGVFAVDTVTVRRRRKWDISLATVSYNGDTLTFPRKKPSAKHISGAMESAKELQLWLKSTTDLSVRVAPVLALPGWNVSQNARVNLPVLSPKQLRDYIVGYGTFTFDDDQMKLICEQLKKGVANAS